MENVHLIHAEGAGCYGQNGSDDVAADAVILSQAVGKPVRVQGSRQDEFVWEPKSPAMLIEVHAGLDSQGNVAAFAVFLAGLYLLLRNVSRRILG